MENKYWFFSYVVTIEIRNDDGTVDVENHFNNDFSFGEVFNFEFIQEKTTSMIAQLLTINKPHNIKCTILSFQEIDENTFNIQKNYYKNETDNNNDK